MLFVKVIFTNIVNENAIFKKCNYQNCGSPFKSCVLKSIVFRLQFENMRACFVKF
jgi:hypothetical protein